jgi:hypothetical protein
MDALEAAKAAASKNRLENSLGELTKKFIQLIKGSAILEVDLN